MLRRVEGIYAGTTGHEGDLLRVTLTGGQLYIGGSYQAFQPLAFKIANGETKTLDVVARSPLLVAPAHAELTVSYLDGLLLIDDRNGSWDRAARVPFEQTWKRSASYQIGSDGRCALRGVTLKVEVIPHRHPGGRR
jgi:hypothetical protein